MCLLVEAKKKKKEQTDLFIKFINEYIWKTMDFNMLSIKENAKFKIKEF